MKAEIITIGDEILIGQIIDTNSAFLAAELNKIGIAVHQISSIEDKSSHILTALQEASQRAEIVLITGGLGPTRDDVTKSSLCSYFEDELTENKEVLQHIEELFEKYIETPISDLNRRQALVPGKAEVLFNKYGTAPGMLFRKDGVMYISLPGVPFEMKELVKNEVLPRLQQEFKRPVILHKTAITYGLGESAIAERISDWEDELPENIKCAYLPNFGKVRIRLTAIGDNEQHLQNSIDGLLTDLHQLIGDIIVGYEDDEPVEIQIGRLLSSARQTIATAESCTAGRVANLLASPPGASVYYKGSVVSYATEIKKEILKIPAEIIEKHSVVSAEVAEAMAKNARSLLKTDFAVSTTGNAGPSKGDSDAEIGTVYIGIATPEVVYSKKFIFGNHREKVIGKTVHKSLELILSEILKFAKT